MYYYRHHIGDFNHATRHLTRTERLIYRDLIDVYYDTEKPLPLDIERIARIALIPKKEMAQLQNVLDEFFIKTEDGYHNARCDLEIAEYHLTAEKSRENGKRGGRPKKPDTNQKETNVVSKENPEETQQVILDNPELTQTKANQEPITNNQNHVTKTQTQNPVGFRKNFYDVFANLWDSVLPELEKGPIFAVERTAHALSATYTDEQICKAIENYATILKSKNHIYTYKHTLEKFLKSHVPQFLDSMKPLENFLIQEKKSKNFEANEAWEKVLSLASKAYSENDYQALPDAYKKALKAIGGLRTIGNCVSSNLPKLKNNFLEAYPKI